MEEDDVIKIVVADGEYMETFAPLPRNKKEADNKVKRGMLAGIGMSEEEIDRVVDQLELQFDDGVDGLFDDGPLTPVVLVRIIRREPQSIDIPKQYIPEPELELEEKPRQVMLQQYYGDRSAERRRRKTFDRFKSHVVKKPIEIYDTEGKKRTVQVYTVEDYEGRTEDSNELLLEGYSTRLERLSRAHEGDFSPYERELDSLRADAVKEIMEKYAEMHEVNPEEAEKFKKTAMEEVASLSDSEFRKKAIQALIDRDTEFIETNNYGYNSHQNTQENLKTLGKYGERAVKAQVSVDQPALQKFGLHSLNVLIEIRNHTTAPVNRAIGTFVAAPVHRALFRVTKSKSRQPVNVDGYLITPMEDMLATSQRHSVGMFKNKPTHRYTARKDYFIEEASRECQARLKRQAEARATKTGEKYNPDSVKRTSPGTLLRLAIIPRIKAVVNYKEGNVAVLNAGLHDLEEAAQDRLSQMHSKKVKLTSLARRIAACDKEIQDLKDLEAAVKDPIKKQQLVKAIEQREHYRLLLEGRETEISRIEIDSVQTDAVSMSQHDKANKSNITKVVKGVKTAGRVAAGVYISRYLYREVAHQAKTPDRYRYIKGETRVEHRIVTEVEPGLDEEGIGALTLEDIYSQGSGSLYQYVTGGNTIGDNTSFFRGLAFRYNGKLFSGSDGVGFDPTKLTDTKIDQIINEDTSLVSIVQEILQDTTQQSFTTEQIEQMILKGEITGLNIWRSSSEQGVPGGWLDASEILSELISGGTHEVKKEVLETITLPGSLELIPGEEYIWYTTESNPVVVAAELGLGALELEDWNEIARFTRSQASIHMRSYKTLEEMKRENDRKRAEAKGKEGSDQKGTKSEKRREIKAFQRSNKSTQRHYAYYSRAMHEGTRREAERREKTTVFEGFFGTRRADLESGYNENAIRGLNNRETTQEDTEERGG